MAKNTLKTYGEYGENININMENMHSVLANQITYIFSANDNTIYLPEGKDSTPVSPPPLYKSAFSTWLKVILTGGFISCAYCSGFLGMFSIVCIDKSQKRFTFKIMYGVLA